MQSVTNESLYHLNHLIWVDPERMSGTPCFYGTRVPVQHLFDYLEASRSIEDFLDGFDGITREQAAAVIHLAREELFAELRQAA